MFLINEIFSKTPERIAALDLGSNSFHMILADTHQGNLKIMDRLKEPVRLGFGLQDDGQLSAEAQERALACLKRFNERLQGYPRGAVKAVGTKTLRGLSDQGAFLAAAQQALGYPIEIISGTEEARLVYLGVSHGVANLEGDRLVIDIGGGSTELILGNEHGDGRKESLSMGCVSMTRQFFNQGKITNKAIKACLTHCAQQLEPFSQALTTQGWQHCLGASGTIKSVSRVLADNGWAEQELISNQGLQKIIDHGLAQGHIDKLELKGLAEDRLPVFFAGVLVLKAVFDALDIKQMQASPFALREGLVFDFLGRLSGQDIRQSSVSNLSQRFHVETSHCQRVRDCARDLLAQVAEPWGLNTEAGQWLDWACQLAEIGLDISHSQFHKHSAYIVEHSDLAGFSQPEQSFLASLLLASRKKFSSKYFKGLDPSQSETLGLRLAVLLRLALVLNRARKAQEVHRPALSATARSLQLIFAQDHLEQYPLLVADLEQEKQQLAADLELIITPELHPEP